MNFKDTVKGELDERYKSMLNSTTPPPFSKKPMMKSSEGYKRKRTQYQQRLNAEKQQFNNACTTVNRNRESRLRLQEKMADERGRKKFRWLQAMKTFMFLLPVLVAVLIGVDVFDKTHGHLGKLTRDFPLGAAIFFYVVFCLLALFCAIFFNVKMYLNEYYIDRHTKGGYKPYYVAAILILVACIGISSLNLSKIVPNIGKTKIVFVGEDVNRYEYYEKGEQVTLPSGSKKKKEHKTYTTKYIFEGWKIDGKLYQKGETYEPKGWKKATAVFTAVDYAKISISVSNARVRVQYGEDSRLCSSSESIEVPLGTTVTVRGEYDYAENQYLKVDSMSCADPYTFTVQKHTYIEAYSYKTGSSGGDSCIVEGTLVMLQDGTQKPIEELEMGDMLAVFNHETGRYEYAPLLTNVHANTPAQEYEVLTLYFSSGKQIRIVGEHGFFNKELNKYIYIRKDNVYDFIGHRFAAVEYTDGKMTGVTVTLERVEFTTENVVICNPASVWHINLVAGDMLTLSAGMVNLFEYDETMKYDEELMAADIEQYGLYTYEDFKEYVTMEVFEAFPFKYYKVAVGKGLYTYEQILWLLDFYYDKDSVN